MKVLFVTRKFPPSIGGMQLFAYDLHKSISSKLTVKLVKWGGSNKALPLVYPYLFIKSFINLLGGGYQVIHIQDGLLAPIGYILSKLFRKPYVVVIHGLDITYSSKLYSLLVVPAIKNANKVICISQAAADESVLKGVKNAKIKVLPIAVNDELYEPEPKLDVKQELGLHNNSQILLTVGRLVKRKGVAWFVAEVMPELVKLNPSAIYLIVGDGPEKLAIYQAITQHKLEDNVRLLGRIEGDLYRSVYNQADVFVMPNINMPNDIEGFGLVLLEASLCQRPIVASNTEGIKDAVSNNKNGILVPVGSTDKFIIEITRFLNDNQYAKRFGAKSRDFTLANYNWSKIADDYVKEYDELA